jgi:hypothetical protein
MLWRAIARPFFLDKGKKRGKPRPGIFRFVYMNAPPEKYGRVCCPVFEEFEGTRFSRWVQQTPRVILTTTGLVSIPL